MNDNSVKYIAIVFIVGILCATAFSFYYFKNGNSILPTINIFPSGEDEPQYSSIPLLNEIPLNSSTIEVTRVLEALSQKDLDESVINEFIQLLNMKMYARNDLSATDMFNTENTYWTSKGYALEYNNDTLLPNIYVIIGLWSKSDTDITTMIVGEGLNTQAYFGYRTVYLRGKGSSTSYVQLVNYIKGCPSL